MATFKAFNNLNIFLHVALLLRLYILLDSFWISEKKSKDWSLVFCHFIEINVDN